jgi:hypothetical protein
MATRTIKLGNKIFRNELSVYADWQTAFWRENFQNSVDANSTRIDIKVEPVDLHVEGNSKCIVTFDDNGDGMSLSTLENIYFVLGETSKTNSALNIGGYGRARLLIFAQDWYKLHTGSIEVDGVGQEWSDNEAAEYKDGVKLTIKVDAPAYVMLEKLRQYLRLCNLPCKVFINGERWNSWTFSRNHKRDLSFGGVYTNQSKSSELLVRVNGTLMFRTWTRAPYQVIVDMFHDDKHNPRTILQANRDGLLDQYRRELDVFVADLNVNKKSALKKKIDKSCYVHGSYGAFVTYRKVRKVRIVDSDVIDLVQPQLGAIAPDSCPSLSSTAVQIADMMPLTTDTVADRSETNLFDIVIRDNVGDNPKIRRIIDSYNPANWDLDGKVGSRFDERYSERRAFRAGFDKYKLLVLWKAAIEEVLQIFVDYVDGSNYSYQWGVGWTFSDVDETTKMRTMASHSMQDGKHFLLLNPVDTEGKMALSLSDREDWYKIIAYAKHEVVHMVHPDHDEDFTSTTTRLDAVVSARLPAIINRMKLAKNAINQREAV